MPRRPLTITDRLRRPWRRPFGKRPWPNGRRPSNHARVASPWNPN